MASTEMAAPCVSFQAKLNSIMEMLAKAAVAEIGKLWEDGFVLVQAELQRRDGEIEALNRKILAMESEKLKAQSKNLTSASSQTTPKRKMLPLNGDGPVITSVQSLASEPIMCNKPETSADHNTPPSPPSRHEKLRKTTQKQANSIKEADLAVKMEEEDDVQIVEPIQTEMDEATQCAEAKDEESQEVCVGHNDGDCLVNSKLLLQNLDSEILLIQNTLDILESSTERTQTDRRIKDNSMLQGTPSNPRATGSISQHNEAIHSNGPVTVCTNSEKPPQIYNSLNPDRSFMFNNSNVNKKTKSFRISEKWFICSFCGKSFDRISHLEMHQRIHTGEKPYKCDICGKCFSQRGNQQKHQSTHKDSY